MRLLPLSLALLASAAPLFSVAFSEAAAAQIYEPAGGETPTLAYYLPPGTDYDPKIPRPESTLGVEVGTWHARPDQLVAYFEKLDAVSERMRVEQIGLTYERRPLLNVYVSSSQNLARLDEILQQHALLSDGKGEDLDLSDMPVVVYLGYSIHGNESSGSNAALVIGYHLAAARGTAIEELLDKTLIVLDPSLNPDGLARFAQWANQNRGRVPVADPRSREHVEPWPNGRTNHYGFDLNRDWLLAVHPESQARLRQFQRLRPNLLADFHEMNTDGTYFFQPGVPSRQNPLTPATNLELTRRVAEFHAKALDRIGSLYYTEESFDDFYFGKGSTYPDVQGGVGILFEQASSRGLIQESANGPLSFPFTIRNQVTSSLSMLEAARHLRRDLLEHQRTFYREALAEAAADPRQAIVFGDSEDPARAAALSALLKRHGIEVRAPKKTIEVDGVRYEPLSSYVVPIRQPQYRLLRGIFEKPTKFADETFYDVSAWTLPLAYGMPHADLSVKAPKPELVDLPAPGTSEIVCSWDTATPHWGEPDTVAYAFSWSASTAPEMLYRLQSRGIRARAAGRGFGIAATGPDAAKNPVRELAAGAIVVPLAGQPLERKELEALLERVHAHTRTDLFAVKTGLTPTGIDLGSPNMQALKKPRPAILVGAPYNVYEAGEVWHLLDHRFGIETTLLEKRELTRADLSRYSHLIFVSAEPAELSKNEAEAVRGWVRAGGVLIATGQAAPWAEKQILNPPAEGKDGDKEKDKGKNEEEEAPARKPYGDFEKDSAQDLVAGAIFEVDLDLTHPLAFGYTRPKLPVFRDHAELLPTPKDPYSRVGVYSKEARLAGFSSDENLKKIAGSTAVAASRMGKGAVLMYLDNPNFRGFWWGGSKLFLNGLFLSGLIDDTSEPEGAAE
jgi:hypothetical protein